MGTHGSEAECGGEGTAGGRDVEAVLDGPLVGVQPVEEPVQVEVGGATHLRTVLDVVRVGECIFVGTVPRILCVYPSLISKLGGEHFPLLL